MSWNLSVPAGPVKEFEERARAAFAASYSAPNIISEVAEQFEAALRAADEMIKSILPPAVEGEGMNLWVGASMNGHANPGHKPTPPYANDMVTVSLYQNVPSPS